MATIGYARVSISDQSANSQVGALQGTGAGRVFVETASGANTARPELAACLEYLRGRPYLGCATDLACAPPLMEAEAPTSTPSRAWPPFSVGMGT